MSHYSSEKVLDALNKAMHESLIESENDSNFIRRVYNGGDLDKYRSRIYSIGFSSLKSPVLDAGSGYGQWSIVLSELNDSVIGIDADIERLKIAKNIAAQLKIENLNFVDSNMNIDKFDDEFFGAIFCYNSIMLSAWKDTLSSFYRVLSKGGLLYFNAYDIGWMIHNIIQPNNPALDFDPCKWSIETIQNTILYLTTNNFNQKTFKDGMFIPISALERDLEAIGFESFSIAGEGLTRVNPDSVELPFYPHKLYGQIASYEVLARK